MSKDTQKKPVGRPLKFKALEQVEELIEEYFKTDAYMQMGDNTIFAPTMSGLAYHLDIDRKTLLNYSNKEEFFPHYKKSQGKNSSSFRAKAIRNSGYRHYI